MLGPLREHLTSSKDQSKRNFGSRERPGAPADENDEQITVKLPPVRTQSPANPHAATKSDSDLRVVQKSIDSDLATVTVTAGGNAAAAPLHGPVQRARTERRAALVA